MLARDHTKGPIKKAELKVADPTLSRTKPVSGVAVLRPESAELRIANGYISENGESRVSLDTPPPVRAPLDAALSDQEILLAELAALRGELAALTAQRDAAFLCTQQLTLEGASLASELHASRGELKKRAAENAQLLDQVDELRSSLERVTVELSAARIRLIQVDCQVSLEAPATDLCLDIPLSATAENTSAAAMEFSIFQLPENGNHDFSSFDSTAVDFSASPTFGAPAEPSGEPIFFLLRPGLNTMEYDSADQVVELYQSINLSHVSAEGRGQENCKGFVCCMRKNGVLQIYTALAGVESGKTWIYLPDEQPADEAAYPRFLREAVRFAEDLGLLMEPVLRDVTPQQHREIVACCPVLRAASLRPRLSLKAPAISGL